MEAEAEGRGATGPGERRRLARDLVLGAPVAGLVWLLIIRVFLGSWSFAFPLLIVGVSVFLALLMCGPEPTASWAYRFWKGLVTLIDWIVTRVVCLVLYYLLFTPIGLILRLCGIRLVSMKPDSGTRSYWRTVSPPKGGKRHFFRQYS